MAINYNKAEFPRIMAPEADPSRAHEMVASTYQVNTFNGTRPCKELLSNFNRVSQNLTQN